MPLYDYDCAACGRRFEVIHGVHADPPTSCPLCGKGPIKKAISAAAVHYRGSGWAKKERHSAIKSRSAAGGGDSSSDAGGSGSDSGSSDTGTSDGASESGPKPAVPAATGSGDSSSGTSKTSKPGAASKPPARSSD